MAQKRASRPQHAKRLAEQSFGMLDVLEHHVCGYQIECTISKREGFPASDEARIQPCVGTKRGGIRVDADDTSGARRAGVHVEWRPLRNERMAAPHVQPRRRRSNRL